MRGRETVTLLGPLERVNLSLIQGSNEVGDTLHLKAKTGPVSEAMRFIVQGDYKRNDGL
jgi:hypothetical protein